MAVDIFSLSLGDGSLSAYCVSFRVIRRLSFVSSLFDPATMRAVRRTYPIRYLYATYAYIGYRSYVVYVVQSSRGYTSSRFLGSFLGYSGFLFGLFYNFLLLIFSYARFGRGGRVFVVYGWFFGLFCEVLGTFRFFRCVLKGLQIVPRSQFLRSLFWFFSPGLL